ncbi:MAG: tRNA lysidine(34) synthetase TilS, partial [Deltaproteobacteria bacterium]|nr:tRNA lysidine(34) synthetase TilS [Deltaproteobacteria bacterium]
MKNQEDPMHFRFYKKVRSVLFRTSRFMQAKKVLVGVSGGIDSSVLLHELACFVAREGGPCLVAVHVHHGIRGEDADLDFLEAQNQAQKHAVPFIVKYLAMGEQKSEEALRQARMQVLEEVALQEGADLILLAQHMQDQAETFLLRLFRGAGVQGLAGMKMLRNERWFRPFLQIQKQEIEQEAQHRNLSYRIDKSNFDTSYRRNAVRHNILPKLQTMFNPNIIHNLADLCSSFEQLDDYINTVVDPFIPEPEDQTSTLLRLQ